ncbi:N/A [soil metagenome]
MPQNSARHGFVAHVPRLSPKQWFSLAKHAVQAWSDDFAPSMGAALSYYTVFSLAPLLLLVISIAGLVFGQDAARGALFDQLNSMMGHDAATAVQGLLKSVSKPSDGIIGTMISLGVLIFGATTVFGELQNALDRIWHSPALKKGGGLLKLLKTRMLSFGMILGIAFLLMVSLVTSAAIAALGAWWSPMFGGWEILAQFVTFVFGFLMTTAIFAMIYKIMPRVHIQWSDVWVGAAVTSVLFNVGRFLIGLYIGKSSVASGFGAAGSLIVVFVWVYYSAQIFFLGAEFTWVYATTYGSKRNQEVAPPPTVPSRA